LITTNKSQRNAMNRSLILKAMLLGALGAHFPHALGEVIPNDVKLATIRLDSAGHTSLALGIQSQDWGLFSVTVQPAGNDTFRFGYRGIAELYHVYAAEPGDIIDAPFLDTALNVIDNLGPSSNVHPLQTIRSGETRYFALWDAIKGFSTSPKPEDRYGWFALHNQGGVLSLTGSATTFGYGLVVGSTTQVPELPAVWMGALGLAAVGSVRRRLR
jgi:hypothetical protein